MKKIFLRKSFYMGAVALLILGTLSLDFLFIYSQEKRVTKFPRHFISKYYQQLNQQAFFSKKNVLSEIVFKNIEASDQEDEGIRETILLHELTNWVKDLEIVMHSITSMPSGKYHGMSIIDFKLDLTSNYSGLLNFINRVESSTYLFEMKNFEVKRTFENVEFRSPIRSKLLIRSYMLQKERPRD